MAFGHRSSRRFRRGSSRIARAKVVSNLSRNHFRWLLMASTIAAPTKSTAAITNSKNAGISSIALFASATVMKPARNDRTHRTKGKMHTLVRFRTLLALPTQFQAAFGQRLASTRCFRNPAASCRSSDDYLERMPRPRCAGERSQLK